MPARLPLVPPAAAAAYGSPLSLGTLVFRVSPMDPATFTSAVLLLCGVAVVAHLAPLRKALRVDPVIALRQE